MKRRVSIPMAEANAARVAVRILIERDRISGKPDSELLAAAYLALCQAVFSPSRLSSLFRQEGFAPAIPPASSGLPLAGFHPQTRRAASRLLSRAPRLRIQKASAQ